MHVHETDEACVLAGRVTTSDIALAIDGSKIVAGEKLKVGTIYNDKRVAVDVTVRR